MEVIGNLGPLGYYHSMELLRSALPLHINSMIGKSGRCA